MGRMFCLPVFSRKNKIKLEYNKQSGTSDDSCAATPDAKSPSLRIAETEISNYSRDTSFLGLDQEGEQGSSAATPDAKSPSLQVAETELSNYSRGLDQEGEQGSSAATPDAKRPSLQVAETELSNYSRGLDQEGEQGSSAVAQAKNINAEELSSEGQCESEVLVAGHSQVNGLEGFHLIDKSGEQSVDDNSVEAATYSPTNGEAREEAEVLTGHLSDPGLYCEKDRDSSAGCADSDCSRNSFDGKGSDETNGDLEYDMCHQSVPVEAASTPSVDYEDSPAMAFVRSVEYEDSHARDENQDITDAPAEDITYTHHSGLKRVEEWVKSIETLAEPLIELPVDSVASVSVHPHVGLDAAITHRDMELGNAVARSLDFHSTVAHFSGIGLTIIPSLGAFSYLRVLKLSANSIAKIAPGSLPKTLHSLDLSRNKISVIEGLRDLTRLRTLNLSYNRISRIGQGLATCTSIRELHLAGNKISEVEGLHRLTKLAFLDLSFNRLSSTKSLDQIAANYTSLAAVNLVGNAVVVNIGEEHLKRFITGLAPNLVYLNKQGIKGTSARDKRVLMGSSSSRHSPHNAPGSKAKRITGSSHRRRPTTTTQDAGKEKQHHHHGRHGSKSSKMDYDAFREQLEKENGVIARMHRLRIDGGGIIQRVRSDGALHERVE